MHKTELDLFIDYYHKYEHNGYTDVIRHMYEHFGREFIHRLPVEYKPYGLGNLYLEIKSTQLWHSTTGPAVIYDNKPEFFIFGCYLTLDQWLPYSALSPEEQLLYKLKYG